MDYSHTDSTMAAEQVAILAQQSLEFQRQTNLLKSFLVKFYNTVEGNSPQKMDTNSAAVSNNEQLATWLSNFVTYSEDIIRELRSLVHKVVTELMPTIRWQCWELDDVVPRTADVKQWYSQLIDICLDVKESMGKVRLEDIPPSFQSLWCDQITPLLHELKNFHHSLLANPIALSSSPAVILRTTKNSSIQVASFCGKRSFPAGAMPKMKAILINEDQAKLVHQFGFPNGIQTDRKEDGEDIYETCGTLTGDTAAYTSTGLWRFPKLSICEIQRKKSTKNDSVLEEKYCFLVYNPTPLESNRIWWCCSRPFLVTVNNSQNSKVTALAFIEESFRVRNRKPFDVPESVPCSELIDALEKYFMRMTNCQRGFTPTNRKFLQAKLLNHDEAAPGENPLVNLGRLREKEGGCTFTFFQWFTGIIEVVNEHLKTYWENGFIVGFIQRLATEELLSRVSHDGAFIVRFSESEFSAITISYTLKIGHESITNSLKPFTCDKLKCYNLPEILQGPICYRDQRQQLMIRDYTKVYFNQVSNGYEVLTWKPKSAAFPPVPREEPAEKAAVQTRIGYVKWAVVKSIIANPEDAQCEQNTLRDLNKFHVPSGTLQFPALKGPEQFLVSSDATHFPVTTNLGEFPATTNMDQFPVTSDIVQFTATSSHSQFPVSTNHRPFTNPIDFDQLLDPIDLGELPDPSDVDLMLLS